MFPISTLCMLLLSAARPRTVGVSFYSVPVSGVFIVPVLTIVLYNRTLQLNCTVSSHTYPNIKWSTTANIMINDTAIVTTNESNYMFSNVLTLNGVDLRYSCLYTCSSTNHAGWLCQ